MSIPRNTFSLGAPVGGWAGGIPISDAEQQLRQAMNDWKGEYSSDVRKFAFLLRIDGDIHTDTEMWGIVAAQKAKKKRDWIEVEIGIPEAWWREGAVG